MKPRQHHVTTVCSYGFWLQPNAPVQWEWFCTCTVQHSGYQTEDDAELGAYEHEQSFELVNAGYGLALLGIGTAGWIAGCIALGLIVAALAILARLCRTAPTIEPPADWIIDRDTIGPRVIEPDPDALWGVLSTDRIPPDDGDVMRVPGYTWIREDDAWRLLR